MNNLVKVSVPIKQNDKQMAMSSSNQSGTGVYYQAMPAVGPDGKNVMKLIPVQRVNGQFVSIQNSSNLPNAYRNADNEPQRVYAQPIHFTPAPVSQSNLPVTLPMQPTVNTRYVLKRPPDINVTLNPLSATGQLQEGVRVSTAAPIRVHVPIVPTKVTQNVVPVASPMLNCGKAITLLNKNQLPVAVKSPVLPSGHYLQIPSNAQVKTLPASALPQAIKKRILTPPVSTHSGASSTTPSLLTAVYVSPVNTMKLGAPVHTPSVSPTPLPVKTLSKTSSQPPSNSVPIPAQTPKVLSKESPGPITPIKWVVQEQSDSAAPCLVPQNSSSMTLEILKTLAQMENTKNVDQNAATKSSPQKSPSGVGPGKDNALVMCNGKMYFVAKKTPEFDKHVTVQLNATESPSRRPSGEATVNLKNVSVPSIQASSNVSGLHVHKWSQTGNFNVNNKVDEIIDLCDEDPQDECFSQRMTDCSASQTCANKAVTVDDDEDSNVIFVSYIPPKSSAPADDDEREKETVPDSTMEEEMEANLGEEVDSRQTEKMVNGQEMENQEEELGSKQEKEVGSGQEAEMRCRQEEEMLSCQKDEMVLENTSCRLDITNQEKDITEKLGSIQSKEPEKEDAYQQVEASPMIQEKEKRQESDRLLKRRFGIRAEVQIHLQRVPSPESKATPKKVPAPKRKHESHSNGVKKKKGDHHENKAENSGKPPSEQCGEMELSSEIGTNGEEVETPCDQLAIPAEKTSASILGSPVPMEVPEQRLNTVSSSTEESKISTVLSSFPEVEPGTESSDAISSPKSRKGKGKQSKMLQDSATIKPSAPECMEMCNSTAAEIHCDSSQPSRTKASKAMAAVEWPEPTPENTASCSSEGEKEPASIEIHCPSESSSLGGELTGGDVFCATPMDPEEVKRHEKIKRLKELLKEKEAALELIRKKII
ncbi:uncharacterized protein lrif1 isoform X2 [Brienomyrus brachyistius]|uniref:uncharacterized protein lrif1 isoform X2 n=1 Tax=Brienomyrus brachyistius TaxID=42636 RepID=UPI0020B370FC|nr:uncharacterized protein lrif1 isoform X2 [Brienomyrus brachyistius]